jgi:hypothetical protein
MVRLVGLPLLLLHPVIVAVRWLLLRWARLHGGWLAMTVGAALTTLSLLGAALTAIGEPHPPIPELAWFAVRVILAGAVCGLIVWERLVRRPRDRQRRGRPPFAYQPQVAILEAYDATRHAIAGRWRARQASAPAEKTSGDPRS